MAHLEQLRGSRALCRVLDESGFDKLAKILRPLSLVTELGRRVLGDEVQRPHRMNLTCEHEICNKETDMGGAISASSMAVIPRDQMSQIDEYPSGPIFISTAIISTHVMFLTSKEFR
jgi:hypothetical protein